MDLTQLQQLLDRARRAEDVFGDDVAAGYKRLARACHPDRFPRGSFDAQWASALFKRLGYWKAKVSSAPPQVVSPQRTYWLGALLGSGDLCDVHHALDDRDPYVLKIPRITGGNNLLAKEREVLEQLIERSGDGPYASYFPAPVETFRAGDRRVNVFRWREGYYTAEQIRDRHPRGLEGRHLAWMLRRVLEAIGYAHNKGWIHGAVLPPHLMFHAVDHGLQLIDWIHAERCGDMIHLVPDRFKSWYPRECQCRRGAGAAADIYLAAKSLIYLAGGDPSSGAMPAAVPAPLQRFIKGCLLESPAMRPGDAWALHDEFSELLEDLYGPPKYHPLDMS